MKELMLIMQHFRPCIYSTKLLIFFFLTRGITVNLNIVFDIKNIKSHKKKRIRALIRSISSFWHLCQGQLAVFRLLRSNSAADGETYTAFQATTCKNFTTICGGHTFTEAMLVNSLAIRGLECSLHFIVILRLLT